MTQFSRANIAVMYARQYLLAFIATSLIYAGLGWFLTMANYPLAGGLLRLVNFVIQTAFRDVSSVTYGYSAPPWQYQTLNAALGTILIVSGILVGLWGNHRENRLKRVDAEPEQ